MKEFKGRVVAPGQVKAEALVSHGGLNTLASFQKALQFGDKKATCGDQNNSDLFNKQMAGKALCLPQTIGSTTGVWYLQIIFHNPLWSNTLLSYHHRRAPDRNVKSQEVI